MGAVSVPSNTRQATNVVSAPPELLSDERTVQEPVPPVWVMVLEAPATAPTMNTMSPVAGAVPEGPAPGPSRSGRGRSWRR